MSSTWSPAWMLSRSSPASLTRMGGSTSARACDSAGGAFAATTAQGPLGGCGLIVVNPPFTLESELAAILPALSAILGGPGGGHRVDWIAAER